MEKPYHICVEIRPHIAQLIDKPLSIKPSGVFYEKEEVEEYRKHKYWAVNGPCKPFHDKIEDDNEESHEDQERCCCPLQPLCSSAGRALPVYHCHHARLLHINIQEKIGACYGYYEPCADVEGPHLKLICIVKDKKVKGHEERPSDIAYCIHSSLWEHHKVLHYEHEVGKDEKDINQLVLVAEEYLCQVSSVEQIAESGPGYYLLCIIKVMGKDSCKLNDIQRDEKYEKNLSDTELKLPFNLFYGIFVHYHT